MALTAGDQPISTLVIGDVVLAYDEASGELGYFAVIDTIVHEDPVVQYLTIDGETITTTPNHPFKTGTGEWVAAGKLQAGDTIRTALGDTGTVEASTFAYAPQPVYNLTIATAHTYFVGEGQWLVHNANPYCGNILGTYNRGRNTAENEAISEVVNYIRQKKAGRNVERPSWVTQNHHFGRASDRVTNNRVLALPDGPQFTLYDVQGGTPEVPGGRGPRRLAVGDDGSIYFTNRHYDEGWWVYE